MANPIPASRYGEIVFTWSKAFISRTFNTGLNFVKMISNFIVDIPSQTNYWYKRAVTKIPSGPSLLYLINHGKKFEDFNSLLDEIAKVHKVNGDIFTIGPLRPTYFLAHPTDIARVMNDTKNFVKYPHQTEELEKQQKFLGKGIIITASDEEWKAQRETLNHPFKPNIIYKNAESVILECLRSLSRRVDEARTNPINVSEEGFIFSGSIIFKLLSAGFSFTREDLVKVKIIFDQGVKAYNQPNYNTNIVPCRAALDQLASRLIQSQLDRQDKEENSLINSLMNGLNKERPHLTQDEIKKTLAPRVINLFTAGFETTGTTFAWALYSLSRHPEVQEKLRSEICEFLATIKMDADQSLEKLPEGEALKKLEYLNAVILEILRLYPALISYSRFSLKNNKAKIGNYTVLPDSEVQMLPFLANRHPDVWKRPNDFNPERHLNQQNNPKIFAFGAGPRMCLGEYLAKRELQLLLISVLSKYKLAPVNEARQIAGVVLHPDQDIFVSFSPLVTKEIEKGMEIEVASHEVAVACSVEKVWSVWCDVANWSKWDPQLKESRLETSSFCQGATVSLTHDNGQPPISVRISYFAKNIGFNAENESKFGTVCLVHNVVSTHDGVKIRHSYYFKPNGESPEEIQTMITSFKVNVEPFLKSTCKNALEGLAKYLVVK